MAKMTFTVSLEDFGKKAAEFALDEITYNDLTIRQWIEKIASGEFAEQRHGRWIECDYNHLEHGFIETEPNAGWCCSNCCAAFQKRKMTYKQYCPHCGAEMEGRAGNG